MENVEKFMVIILILAAGIYYFWIRLYHARKEVRRQQQKKNAVVARVKTQENGVWRCKFFWCGDRWGFIRREPSDSRFPAYVVGFDEKENMFELEEQES